MQWDIFSGWNLQKYSFCTWSLFISKFMSNPWLTWTLPLFHTFHQLTVHKIPKNSFIEKISKKMLPVLHAQREKCNRWQKFNRWRKTFSERRKLWFPSFPLIKYFSIIAESKDFPLQSPFVKDFPVLENYQPKSKNFPGKCRNIQTLFSVYLTNDQV